MLSSRLHSARTPDDDRVMTFNDWCALNGFSESTGQRLIKNGHGPRFIKLSPKRKGVTVAENRRWQQSRQINPAAERETVAA